jgi:hypothetical protein
MMEAVHSQTNLTSVIKSESGNLCEGSCKTSLSCCCGEAHTIVESLIPYIEDTVLCVLGDNCLKVIKIPLAVGF